MDADGLTYCCATRAEERAARRLGVAAVRVGVRAANGVPDGKLVSFGLAGALSDALRVGEKARVGSPERTVRVTRKLYVK